MKVVASISYQDRTDVLLLVLFKVLAYYKYVKDCRQQRQLQHRFWSVNEAEDMRAKWQIVNNTFDERELSRRMVSATAVDNQESYIAQLSMTETGPCMVYFPFVFVKVNGF